MANELTTIAEQVARDHRAQEVLTPSYVGCTCGLGPLSFLSHAAHVAHVAVRAAVRFEAERVNDRPAGSDARAWLLARIDPTTARTAVDATTTEETP